MVNQVLSTLDNYKIQDPVELEEVRQALKVSHRDEATYHNELAEDLEKEYQQMLKRMNLLYDDRMDGVITKEDYQRRHQECEEKLTILADLKQKLLNAKFSYLKLGISLFELAQKGVVSMKVRKPRAKRRNY